MIVLGIHDGHGASAALMKDGEIIAAVEEERFSKLKMDCGYPRHAIDFCIKSTGISAEEIDHFAFATEKYHALYMGMKMNSMMSIDDWIEYNDEYFKPLLYEGKDNKEFIFSLKKRKKFRDVEHWYDFSGIGRDYDFIRDSTVVRNIRLAGLQKHLGVNSDRVRFFDHHSCHAYYGMFGAPRRIENTIIFTLDGGGDGSVSTVFRYRDGKMLEIARTNFSDVARFYRYVSLVLGMRPGHHEYKVMGLAPYATNRETEKSWKFFKDRMETRDDLIQYKEGRRPKDIYFTMQDAFRGHRFDGIAGAVQKMTEEVVGNWIISTAQKYGAKAIRFSGGVAMNIKLNMLLAEDGRIDDFYVCPSPTDNTLSFGACYMAALVDQHITPDDLVPINDIYLGPNYDHLATSVIKSTKSISQFEVIDHVTPEIIGKWLAEGAVVARASGKMEFGERALGNRSILANPQNPETIEKINTQIKYRDFWMPFAPVIKRQRVRDYLLGADENIESPYMMVGGRSTELARAHIPAALHPADRTLRPQVLDRKANNDYWEIIDAFEKITGVGGLLNTSFNLHGEPIVCTPADAVSTFERSELDVVVIGSTAISRSKITSQ